MLGHSHISTTQIFEKVTEEDYGLILKAPDFVGVAVTKVIDARSKNREHQ